MPTVEPLSDQSNKDFFGANLSGLDLHGVNFANANLRGVDFTGSNLNGANFEGAALAGTDFVGADISNANFSSASFQGGVHNSYQAGYSANFRGANLTSTDFSGAYVESASFSDSNFEHAIISDSTFRYSGFDERHLHLVEGEYQQNYGTSVVYRNILTSLSSSKITTALLMCHSRLASHISILLILPEPYHLSPNDPYLTIKTTDNNLPITHKITIKIPLHSDPAPLEFSQTIELPKYLSGRNLQLTEVSVSDSIGSAQLSSGSNQYFVDDGFGRALDGFDLHPGSESGKPILEFSQFSETTLSESDFSYLIDQGHFEDLYGLNVVGSYSDESDISFGIIYFETRHYLNEEQSSYVAMPWQAQINPEDIQEDGSFDVIFYAPKRPEHYGSVGEILVRDALVFDEFYNSSKPVLADTVVMSDSVTVTKDSNGAEFPYNIVNLNPTKSVSWNDLSVSNQTDGNLPPFSSALEEI